MVTKIINIKLHDAFTVLEYLYNNTNVYKLLDAKRIARGTGLSIIRVNNILQSFRDKKLIVRNDSWIKDNCLTQSGRSLYHHFRFVMEVLK